MWYNKGTKQMEVEIMWQVFRVFWEDGELKEYYWGEWEDRDKANEVALELRDGSCFSTVVHYKEN